jgi:4-hydroxythreonine-4-phosphate dehydrogenase
MDIRGPIPADAVFLKARQAKNVVVVTWYHDQGLIPFKLLNVHSGVNLTLGLPFIRTSPDHGTAYDIAGRGVADPSSMIQAIQLAERLIGV